MLLAKFTITYSSGRTILPPFHDKISIDTYATVVRSVFFFEYMSVVFIMPPLILGLWLKYPLSLPKRVIQGHSHLQFFYLKKSHQAPLGKQSK